MSVTNRESGANVHEIADGIYRINTPVPLPNGGGFSLNQYLIVDDEPLHFHTGLRKLCSLVREAVASLLPIESLRYIGFSHVEADECGSTNDRLAAAPRSVPLCATVAAMVSVDDLADQSPVALADGKLLPLGRHRVRCFDAPHLPHARDCSYLFEADTRTLLCGDLFTQGGTDLPAVTVADILGPSEVFRQAMDYFSHTTRACILLERLAAAEPTTLACMHGSAWQGDGAVLLGSLSERLAE